MEWIVVKKELEIISESRKREKSAKECQQRNITGILDERKDFSYDLR
jgi:hypothetical protein